LKTLWDAFISLLLNVCAYALSLLMNSYSCDYLSFASNKNKFMLLIKSIFDSSNYDCKKLFLQLLNERLNMKSYCECAQSMPFYWFFDFFFFLHTFCTMTKEKFWIPICAFFDLSKLNLLYFHATVTFLCVFKLHILFQ
jgi:hypothetical protein